MTSSKRIEIGQYDHKKAEAKGHLLLALKPRDDLVNARMRIRREVEAEIQKG